MGACWAACLGDCSQKLSREHLVSGALFITDTVRVQGFSWCKDSAKEIGLAALTAKVLCKHHNEALSCVDRAGAEAFSVLREIGRLSNVRGRMKPRRWRVARRRIDGLGLERWFLKTLINLCCHQIYPIGRNSNVPGRPTDRLVQTAYGLGRFGDRAGLYSIVRVGMTGYSSDAVGFAPLIINRHGKHIEGGLFSFRGFWFLLFLEPEGPPTPLTGLSIEGEDLGQCQLNFHNRQMYEDMGGHRSQILTIDW